MGAKWHLRTAQPDDRALSGLHSEDDLSRDCVSPFGEAESSQNWIVLKESVCRI